MNIKQFKKLVDQIAKENPTARVMLSSDEEGNSYGDVDNAISVDQLNTGETAITFYPLNSFLPEELIDFETGATPAVEVRFN